MSAFTHHQGVVYFVTCGQYVKIDYCSGDLKRRIKVMLRGRLTLPHDIDESQPLVLIHTIPGCIGRDEKRIHALFARHHVIGEWFRYDLAFVRHLANLDYVTDREVLARFRHARRELKKARTRQVVAQLTPTPGDNPRSLDVA